MLFTAENTRAVASALGKHFDTHGRIPLVCDPVCVSTSGHVLLQSDAVDTITDELFPLSQVITPNQAEAELLLRQSPLCNKERSPDYKITSLDDMLVAARDLLALRSEAVLLKGGHVTVSKEDIRNIKAPEGTTLHVKSAFLLEENTEILQKNTKTVVTDLVVDVLCRGDAGNIAYTLYPRPRLQSRSTHGTGCTLSAALVCALGNGIPSE